MSLFSYMLCIKMTNLKDRSNLHKIYMESSYPDILDLSY